jgi:hypothetical protein
MPALRWTHAPARAGTKSTRGRAHPAPPGPTRPRTVGHARAHAQLRLRRRGLSSAPPPPTAALGLTRRAAACLRHGRTAKRPAQAPTLIYPPPAPTETGRPAYRTLSSDKGAFGQLAGGLGFMSLTRLANVRHTPGARKQSQKTQGRSVKFRHGRAPGCPLGRGVTNSSCVLL